MAQLRTWRFSAVGIRKRLEEMRPGGVPQLPQGLVLDLSDTLAGDVEGPPDLLEGVLGAVSDAESAASAPAPRAA
jgi:hypothetical protein